MTGNHMNDFESRQLIAEVASGSIEMVFDGDSQLLQFNCSCDDALPYCRAMCCRHRPYFNILLESDEIEKFKSVPHPQRTELFILQEEGSRCVYLNNDTCDCVVHTDKPKACAAYHCSPGGVGDNIKMRDVGWLLLPRGGNLQGVELQPQ